MNVFVSHADADTAVAKELQSRLTAAGLKVWQSEEVLPGQNWGLEVGRALEKADAMLLLLSPEALKSNAVRYEMDYALTQERFQDRLIPVLVRPTRGIPAILLHACRLVNWHENPEDAVGDIMATLRTPRRSRGRQPRPARAPRRREPVRVAN